MAKDFKFEKRLILTGVTALLLADVALGVYSWHLSNSPTVAMQDLTAQSGKLTKLKAEIEAAEKTAADFPKTVKDCDKFEQSLPTADTVSSTVAGDLSDIAKKSSIQLVGVVFHDKEKEKDAAVRNISERTMDATVAGGYDGVVKFMNGLQKSQNFYVVDSLELATEATAPNVLRVAIHMRTFFRTAAS